MSITEVKPGAPRTVAGSMLEALADELAAVVRGLDVGGLPGAEGARLTETFARMERLAMAGKTLAAGRVAASGYCREAGFPNAQRWLADSTKASLWEANKTIQTGTYLADDQLGPTRDALVSGQLTATQANEIATASAGKPEEQQRLLALAQRETTAQLKAECRKIRLADKPPDDPEARRKRIAEELAFGHRDVGGGMSELFARMPTSVLVMVLAAVRHQFDAVFARARAEGRDDPHQVYMVEALVTLLLVGPLDGTGTGDGGEGDDARPGLFDGATAGAVDGDDIDDEDGGDGFGGDQRHRPGAYPGGGPSDDIVYGELLAALRGEPPLPRPPRRERSGKQRGRCRCGGRVMPAAKIIVRVDQSALLRGYAAGDEVCDIAGVGPWRWPRCASCGPTRW